ncbi:MAG: hypothetical protein J6J03_07255 [Tyzzerella sp.]|nr:hypothetical protein [Tyzzerella sp.]
MNRQCKNCRARCTGAGKEGNANQCTFYTEQGSSLPYPWRPASSPPKVPIWMNLEDCPEFIVAIKFAEEATTLRYRPDIGWFDDNNTYTVTAWCPLPDLP